MGFTASWREWFRHSPHKGAYVGSNPIDAINNGGNMIYIVGDLHGNFARLDNIKQYLTPDDILIQVGDFGFYPEIMKEWKNFFSELPCKLYAIDGNHEDFVYLSQFSKNEPTEILPNLFYVPRGTVMEIEGWLFGFLGGGESVDKAHRVENVSWWKEEQITDDDVQKLLHNVNGRTLDYLITHVPPKFTILSHFGPFDTKFWGLPDDWEDISAQKISQVYWTLQPRNLLCGHMHRSVRDGIIRIVDIDEVVSL